MLNSEKNIIIDNILSSDEIDILKNIINDEKQKLKIFEKQPESFEESIIVKNKDFARLSIKSLKLPDSILNKIELIVKEKCGNNYKLFDTVTYLEYAEEYGNPKLTDHTDKTEQAINLHVDYQLDANVDWAIKVEENSYILKNNQALTFDGFNQVHSRKFLKFKPGQFVKMILFRFQNIDLQGKSDS